MPLGLGVIAVFAIISFSGAAMGQVGRASPDTPDAIKQIPPMPTQTAPPASLPWQDGGSAVSIPRRNPLRESCRVLGAQNTGLIDTSGFNLREKIGQMLLFGFQGTSADQAAPRAARDQIERGQLGGVFFLKHNVETNEGVKALAHLFRSAKAKLPPLIAVDQEGGAVQRFGRKVTIAPLPRAAKVGSWNNWGRAYRMYLRQAGLLKSWGINLNFGPVLDVNVEPSNPIIGRIGRIGRSYSPDPEVVEDYGRAFVLGHRKAGVGTALKHFPGHGSSTIDSHKGFVDISRTWQREKELAPFRKLVSDGCADMVMIGHLFHQDYQDREGGNDPATFSQKVINGLLRGELGFKGIVITDDLEMAAIREHNRYEDTLIKAVRAGNNILLVSNTIKPRLDLPGRSIDIIQAEAEKDPVFRGLVEKSFQRIVAFKQRLAITR